MKILHLMIIRIVSVWALILLFAYSMSSYATECPSLDAEVVKEELIEIRDSLVTSTSIQTFQLTINQRYDVVEARLKELDACVKENDGIAVQHAELKEILLQLRVDARQLLFTKYENWQQVRNNELNLLRKVEFITTNPVKVGKDNSSGYLSRGLQP